MKRSFSAALARTVFAMFLLTAATVSQAVGAGSITGQILDSTTGSGLAGLTVYFLDAVNAVIRGSALSNENGAYQSGPLPSASYKVRIEGGMVKGIYYPPAYYNANGDDLWELGGVVQVSDGDNVVANFAQEASDPTEAVECSATIVGTVTNSAGGPLGGIQVSARNALNAMPVVRSGVPATATTDINGQYELKIGGICVSDKIRFADASGNYLPEYSGAGGADDFSLGAALSRDGFDKTPRELNESLASTPADEAIQNVIDLVADIGLSTDTNLTGGLELGITILQDANPNNDTASCGILDSFIRRVNNQLKTGQLTDAEATTLIQNSTAAKNAIGCQ